MTDYSRIGTCEWCGVEFAIRSGQGRPPKYCRRSHRQRAFEARCLAARLDLDSGEALVDAGALARLRDRIYVLESALDDVDHDLEGDSTEAEYREAFGHLYAAAAQLRDGCVEPRAVLRRHPEGMEI